MTNHQFYFLLASHAACFIGGATVAWKRGAESRQFAKLYKQAEIVGRKKVREPQHRA